MIKVNESNIASIMIDTGTIMWEVDHQAHLERVQIEGEKNGKIRESLLQIEYSRPNAEARAIYSFPRSSGKNLVSINHLGAKYGVGLVEQRRGGKSEKVMKNDVVIGESWSGFTKLGQVVDVVVRTRVEQKCVRCQMWFPMAPNNTLAPEIQMAHGGHKNDLDLTPTPTGEIEECGYVLQRTRVKIASPIV